MAVDRRLADELEISRRIYMYCRAVDRLDRKVGYSVWHEDGTADYGDDLYVGSGHGFIDWVCEQHSKMSAHSHQVTNLLIEVNEDQAVSEAYVIATLQAAAEISPSGETRVRHMTFYGRYLDRWSRRGGAWRIDHRVFAIDLDNTQYADPPMFKIRGRRDLGDVSYQLFSSGLQG